MQQTIPGPGLSHYTSTPVLSAFDSRQQFALYSVSNASPQYSRLKFSFWRRTMSRLTHAQGRSPDKEVVYDVNREWEYVDLCVYDVNSPHSAHFGRSSHTRPHSHGSPSGPSNTRPHRHGYEDARCTALHVPQERMGGWPFNGFGHVSM